MNQQTYVRVSGAIFTVVALMHALRLVRKWDMVIGGWAAPTWLSVAGILIAGYLAFTAFRLPRSNG
jgi:ATP/ADP translocase